MSNFAARASLTGAVAIANFLAGSLAVATTCLASPQIFFFWLFSRGPTKENDTMTTIKENIKQKETIERKKKEEARKAEEEARKIEEYRKRNALQIAEHQRQVEEMAAKMERDKQKQCDQRLLEQQRQAEEAVAVAEQWNEEEMRRLIEEKNTIEERGRSLQDNIITMNRALEQKRAARENGVQPIVLPTNKEYHQALVNAKYSCEKFHFAIAGKAGSGKSSIINAFLDLDPGDPRAAGTGTSEATLKIGRYPDPGDQPPRSLTIWFDVPGAGTQRFSSWQYFNKLGLFVFDFIIVAIGDRFEETDCQILRECRKFNIPSFIVRSKADQYILNLMREKDRKIRGLDGNEECYLRCREIYINDTERMVSEELERAGLPYQRVYIVSRDALRDTYSSSLTQLTMTVPEDVIHEVSLVEDLMQAVTQRRCSAEEIEEAKKKYTASTSSQNQNHKNSAQASTTAHRIYPVPKEKHASSVQTASDTNTVGGKLSDQVQRKWETVDSTWIKRVLYLPDPTDVDDLRTELRAQNPALRAMFPAPPIMFSPKVAVLYFYPKVDIPSEVTVFGRTIQLELFRERAPKNPAAKRSTAATRDAHPQSPRVANT